MWARHRAGKQHRAMLAGLCAREHRCLFIMPARAFSREACLDSASPPSALQGLPCAPTASRLLPPPLPRSRISFSYPHRGLPWLRIAARCA